MDVFAKIFAQIFDSSISADYVVRHVFMDLLVLADRDGVVDMTPDAIARRTNVPEKIVLHAISELMKSDCKSRSHEAEGCRLVMLDSHRDWGWQIVNYEHYRNIKDEEARRTYFRDKKRAQRQRNAAPECPQMSNLVKDIPTLSNKVTQAEAEAEAEAEASKKKKHPSPSAQSVTLYGLYPRKVGKDAALKAIDKALGIKSFDALLLAVQAFGRKISRDETEERFIPHPATWFNQGRYDDEEFKRQYTAKSNGGSGGKIDRNAEAAARVITSIEGGSRSDGGELLSRSGNDGGLFEIDGEPAGPRGS